MEHKKKEIRSHEEETKTISVLFTAYRGFFSRIISLASGFKCTHVSISLDEKDEYFYSFNTKGVKKEYPRKHKKRTKKNTCFRLQIPATRYNTLRSHLQRLEREQKSEKKKRKYDYWGVFLCLFRLHRFKNKKKKYFCSSFVAEQLQKARIINLKKKNTSYLPYQLQKELRSSSSLTAISQNIFIE